MIGLLLVLSLLYLSHSFNITCPSAGQWLLVATDRCSATSKYTCLFDFNDGIYKESCSGPIAALPGEKRVTSNKNLDIKPCTLERFQPISFSTTQSSDCLFRKGKCREDGLLIYGNGTSERDRTCRCDHTRGFAFVSSNRTDPCSCNAATEDCSCYKKSCNGSQVLSPDYNCINEADQQGTYLCPSVSSRESIKPVTNVVSDNDTAIVLTYVNVYIATCRSVFVVVIIVFIVLGCCWLKTERKHGHYWTLLKNRCTKFKVVRHLEENVECIEGQSATFTCEINHENIPGKWFIDHQELSQSQSLSITVDGTLHELKIHHVKFEDRGNYSFHIRNKPVSSSSLTVIEPETQEESNYAKLLNLLNTEAESIVRQYFDEILPPKQLQTTLDKNRKKLNELLHQDLNILFPKEVDYSIKFRIQNYDFNSLKEIEKKKLQEEIETAVSSLYSRVEGHQIVTYLGFLPGSLIVVLTLTSKHFYDKDILQSTIKSAVYDGEIGFLQTERSDFVFKMLGKKNVPVSSKDFDIRLMIILMQNLADLNISEDNENNDIVFLSRIKHHSLKIEKNIDKRISDKEFEKDWKELSVAVIHFGGEPYKQICNDVKNFQSSEQLQTDIIKPLDDQHCIEGEAVQFTCKVNQDIHGKWRKNGVELKPSESISITAEGRIHQLKFHSVTINDRGYYSFKVMDKSCGGHLLIEDLNYIRLCHLLKTVAEPAVRRIFDREIVADQLEMILKKEKTKIDHLRRQKHINRREYDLLYPKVVEYSMKFTIKNHDYKTTVQNEEKDKKLRDEIQNAVSDICYGVQGTRKVEVVELKPGSLIAVFKLTASQFAENILMEKIKSAVDDQEIGSFETDLSGFEFKKLGNVPVSLSSKDLDIRLMMILMKNLIDINIADVLPFETDVTEVADLSRIKHIRNKIVQNSDRRISDDDFEEDWSCLSQALVRLGGNTFEKKCKDLKNFKPTSQQCQDYLHHDNLQCDQESTSTESLTDEYMKEASIQNLARDVVRRKFDKQFPPQTLEKEIEKLRHTLKTLKDQRGITQSQWDDLFPVDKGSLSSTRFDIKVMIILLSNSSFKDKEIFKTIENLQNYLSRPKDEKKAIIQAINEISEKE